MLKVIIADDEKTTRESLKEYIKWEAHGIDNVRTAKDGLDALDLANRDKPDILITDVRMPKMDGISLATKIRELFPDCRIIFISGYSDKEYLKSAIHLKAVSYIEKPIDLQEVESVVGQAARAYMEDDHRRIVTEQLKNNVDQSIPYIRQEIVLDMIKGITGSNALTGRFNSLSQTIADNSPFMTAGIKLNWKPGVDDKIKSNIKHRILEMFCDPQLFDQSSIMAGISPEDILVLVISGQAAKNLNSSGLILSILENLNTLSNDDLSVSIGTGPVVRDLSDLPSSYAQATKALSRQFYSGSNKIYDYSSNMGQHFNPDKNLYSDFQSFLKKDDIEGAIAFIKNLSHSIRMAADHEIDHIKNIYFNLLILIYEAARDRNLIDPVDESEKSYIWQEIIDIQSLSECSDYIISNLSAVFSKFDNKDNVSRKEYEITKYINECFGNKDFSIQMIADKVHFSQTYLCSFFKKSTGKTLNEYITDVRIEKARKLLQDGNIKLYEVALRIGFTDSNYFSTLFKKIVGCSPSEYREKFRL